MINPIDHPVQDGVLPMTPVRRRELQSDLERASDELASALRRGGSPRCYKDLGLLVVALDAARQVLASHSATRR